MGSISGTSSGSSTTMTQISGSSDSDLQALMDERKRKRMISNRESARRSRMRKQKRLDDLMAQVNQLQKQNHEIITNINFTKQHLLNVESENSVLRAQFNELSHRLQALNEIVSILNGGANDEHAVDHSFLNLFCVNQSIMASADNMFQY